MMMMVVLVIQAASDRLLKEFVDFIFSRSSLIITNVELRVKKIYSYYSVFRISGRKV